MSLLVMETSRRRVLTGAVVALPTAAVLAGCGSSSGSDDSMDKVRFITGFGTTPREETPLIGQQAGIFRRARLDVTITPGDPATSLKAVAAGKADFSDVDFVTAAKALLPPTGSPVSGVKAVAVMQYRSMTALISRADTGIKRPSDLEGHTVASAAGAASQTLFPTYCKQAGVDVKKVNWTNADPTQLSAMLAAKKVDAIASYVSDLPFVQKTVGADCSALVYSDYLTDLYGSVFVANTDLINRKPDVARRATKALADSVHYAVTHPTRSGSILSQHVPDTDATAATQVMRQMAPYVHNGGFDKSHLVRALTLLESADVVSGVSPTKFADLSMGPSAIS